METDKSTMKVKHCFFSLVFKFSFYNLDELIASLDSHHCLFRQSRDVFIKLLLKITESYDYLSFQNSYRWWLQNEDLLSTFPPSRRIKLNLLLTSCKKKKIIYSFCFYIAKLNVKSTFCPHTPKICMYWLVVLSPKDQATHQFYNINTCTTLTIRKHLVDPLQFHLLMINTPFGLASFSCMQLDNWAQSGICIKNEKWKNKFNTYSNGF